MEDNTSIFSAMQIGNPYKSYRKTILAKVFVNYLDSFSGASTGKILYGDPKKDDNAIIDVWTEKEDVFFRRMNKRQFETGKILEFVRVESEPERGIESYGDDELKTILNSKFFSLQSIINGTESEAVLLRMLDLADEMEKSDKLMTVLKSRLSELQGSASKFPESITTEL